MNNKSFNLKKLSIIAHPDPRLKRVAHPIVEITPEIVDLVDRMAELMFESCGIGLAATQVGVPLRLIVISPNGTQDDTQTIINPVLKGFHGFAELEEGCLSVPGVRAKVRRPAACTVEALDLEGNHFVMDAVDLTATVLQHETDHLDGVLFIDRLTPVTRIACRKAIRQLENDYAER